MTRTIQWGNKKTWRIELYESSFNKNYSDPSEQKTYQDELYEQPREKIFFITAYRSASKGFNPIIKIRNGKEDIEKDFDCLALLMDQYYTLMGPVTKKSNEAGEDVGREATVRHFALMKGLLASNQILEIKELSEYLYKQEARDFRQTQHQVLLGKGLLQAIGRTERKDFPHQRVKIFINEETRQNLVQFYKYLEREEPHEIQKLSVHNHAVYVRVQEEEQKHSIPNYEDHFYQELDASQEFRDFREEMLNEIEKFHNGESTIEITEAWEALRDPLAFRDPQKYLTKLKKTAIFPDSFIDALFFENKDHAFKPYLEEIKDQKFWIISDSKHGDRPYHYQKRLYPDYLKYGYSQEDEIFLHPSTNRIYQFYVHDKNVVAQ